MIRKNQGDPGILCKPAIPRPEPQPFLLTANQIVEIALAQITGSRGIGNALDRAGIANGRRIHGRGLMAPASTDRRVVGGRARADRLSW